MPVAHLVLRYALCIAYLKTNDFTYVCEAAENLLEMIESGYASKLPALYLAIAKAYCALNRLVMTLSRSFWFDSKALQRSPNLKI